MKQYLNPLYAVHLMVIPYKWSVEPIIQACIVWTTIFIMLIIAPLQLPVTIYYITLLTTVIMYTPNVMHWLQSRY